MPVVPIKLEPPLDSGDKRIYLDKEELPVNGYIDSLGYFRDRPSVKQIIANGRVSGLLDFPANSDYLEPVGIYFWKKYKALVVIFRGGPYNSVTKFIQEYTVVVLEGQGNNVWYKRYQSNIAFPNIARRFENKPSFIERDDSLYYCITGVVDRIDFATGTITPLITNFNVDKLVVLDNYAIANEAGSNKVRFSTLGNFNSWPANNFFTAEGDDDIVVTLETINRELYLFGERTLEVWANDGVNPFSRIDGAFYHRGCSARSSPIVIDEKLYFLDNYNRISVATARGVQTLVTSVDSLLSDMPSSHEAVGSHVRYNTTNFYQLDFPSAATTILIDVDKGYGYRWSTEVNQDKSNSFILPQSIYIPEYNVNIGFRRGVTNEIGYLTHSVDRDFDVYYKTCRYTTPFLDHGYWSTKQAKSLHIKCTRGNSPSTQVLDDSRFLVRWKDQDLPTWKGTKQVSMGANGDYRNYLVIKNAGQFTNRKWQFISSKVNDIAFGDIVLNAGFLGGASSAFAEQQRG